MKTAFPGYGDSHDKIRRSQHYETKMARCCVRQNATEYIILLNDIQYIKLQYVIGSLGNDIGFGIEALE